MSAATDLDTLTEFFGRYGSALLTGDIPALAACYALPGMVVAPTYNFSFTTPAAVALSFLGAVPDYQAHRLVAAHAEVTDRQPMGDGLALVAVEWEYLDGEGHVVPGEPYRYLLRLTDEGPAIAVVMPVR